VHNYRKGSGHAAPLDARMAHPGVGKRGQASSPTDQDHRWHGVDGLHVLGNGTRCRTLPSDSPWIPPVFSRIDRGWESYQADAERSICVDDFVLGAQRIGCPPAP
jgi:hypothetical protein